MMRLLSGQEVRVHAAFPLDMNLGSSLEDVLLMARQAVHHVLGHLNLANLAVALHPGGNIDRVAPYVIRNLRVISTGHSHYMDNGI